ncbi:MAG: PqqD family protein [Armatimonadetes bacterium]|nr:PqqD family protein [Armatimonadota bacterium]
MSKEVVNPIRNGQVAWRIIEGRALLITPWDSMMHALNEAATAIWQYLDGSCKESDIAAAIAEQFDVPLAEAESDVRGFLQELL